MRKVKKTKRLDFFRSLSSDLAALLKTINVLEELEDKMRSKEFCKQRPHIDIEIIECIGANSGSNMHRVFKLLRDFRIGQKLIRMRLAALLKSGHIECRDLQWYYITRKGEAMISADCQRVNEAVTLSLMKRLGTKKCADFEQKLRHLKMTSKRWLNTLQSQA